MATVIQPSFAKGEIGPSLYGRVDTAAYQVALRTARNVIIHSHGGVSNRPGTRFLCPVKDHANIPVLLPFDFKATDTYVLEFGNLYMRVVREDAQVLETTKTITAATKASPVVVDVASHGYSNGDHVFISGVGGMTELNGRWFIVANKNAGDFELTSPYDSSNIDGTSFTTYTTGGDCGKVFEISTPYAQADLDKLVFTQSADVMTITHSTYAPRELGRTDHNTWTLTQPTFSPSIPDPATVAVAVNGADEDIYWKYKVTAIKKDTFEESLAGVRATGQTVISATAANPVSVNITAHNLDTGDEVELTGFTEMTEVNGRRFVITKVDANNFTLDAEDGTDGRTAESTGGANTCFPTFVGTGTTAAPTGTKIPDNTITYAAVSGAIKYLIYRAKGGEGDYGFLAETAELTYTDAKLDAGGTITTLDTDLAVTPPVARDPFLLAVNYPGAVGYYQQRRVFGGSTSKPDTSEYSKTGHQSNFSKSRPTQADDAITATLSSRRVNQIRHYIPGKDLVVLTEGAEWRINSGDNSGFAAETLKQEPQTNWGANFMPPIVVGQTILYGQENSAAVRSLGYQLNIDGYSGTDLTLLAPHIFETHTMVAWGYVRSPDPLTVTTRSDGQAAAMTFNQEQEVLAWSRWDTRGGKFKWATSVRPSASEIDEAVYFVVERIIDGNTVGFIERLASRRFEDIQDAFFVDSGLTLDSPKAITGSTAADPVVLTVAAHGFSDGDEVDIEGIQWTPQYDSIDNETNPDQLNGGKFHVLDGDTNTFALGSADREAFVTEVTQADPGVVSAAGHGFSNGDLVNLHDLAGMVEANDTVYKVASVTADTFELNTVADATVDTSAFTAYTGGGHVHAVLDGSSFEAYVSGGNARVVVSTVSGLNHLEGEELDILANGNVVTGKTVTDGKVTLDEKASRVHLGKKMVSDVETLNVEAPEGTIQGKLTKISQVAVRVTRTRGLLIGPTSDKLVEMKWRKLENMDEPTAMLTGDNIQILPPTWRSNGRFFIRQNSPLPFTILALIPDLEVQD